MSDSGLIQSNNQIDAEITHKNLNNSAGFKSISRDTAVSPRGNGDVKIRVSRLVGLNLTTVRVFQKDD